MSLHAELDPQAQERLRVIQRNNTISSIVVAVLTVLLIGLVFGLIALKSIVKETPTFVTIEAPPMDEKEPERKRVQFDKKPPSSPSSAQAKVIVANTINTVAVPVPETEVTTPSLEFGDGNDFGSGWGDGDGSGGGGGTFFNNPVKGNRIAYVVDFSLSMGVDRFKLMQKELEKSLRGLNSSTKFQLVMFAGPAWVVGDDAKEPTQASQANAVIRVDGDKYKWERVPGKGWAPVGAKRRPEWLTADKSTIEETVSQMKRQRKIWGTQWDSAVDIALRLDPAPDVIFFMTDGTCPGHEKMASDIAKSAKARNITVNTIALMEPEAKPSLSRIARESGGTFTMVEKNGRIRTMSLEEN